MSDTDRRATLRSEADQKWATIERQISDAWDAEAVGNFKWLIEDYARAFAASQAKPCVHCGSPSHIRSSAIESEADKQDRYRGEFTGRRRVAPREEGDS